MINVKMMIIHLILMSIMSRAVNCNESWAFKTNDTEGDDLTLEEYVKIKPADPKNFNFDRLDSNQREVIKLKNSEEIKKFKFLYEYLNPKYVWHVCGKGAQFSDVLSQGGKANILFHCSDDIGKMRSLNRFRASATDSVLTGKLMYRLIRECCEVNIEVGDDIFVTTLRRGTYQHVNYLSPAEKRKMNGWRFYRDIIANHNYYRVPNLGATAPVSPSTTDRNCFLNHKTALENFMFHEYIDMVSDYLTAEYRPCKEKIIDDCQEIYVGSNSKWALSKCTINKVVQHQLEFTDKYRTTSKFCWPESEKDELENPSDELIGEYFSTDKSSRICMHICLPSRCCMSNQDTRGTINTNMGRVKYRLCEKCFCIEYKGVCKSTVKSQYGSIIVELSGNSFIYDITIADTSYKGTHDRQRSIEYKAEGPGTYRVSGHCNGRRIDRDIIWTSQEYCDSKYIGITGKPARFYCKNSVMINYLIEINAIFLLLRVISTISAKLISVPIAVILLPVIFFFRRNLYCNSCRRFKFIKHTCNYRECFFCGEDIISEESNISKSKDFKEQVLRRHHSRCGLGNAGNSKTVALILIATTATILTQIFKKCYILVLLISASVLVSYAQAVEEDHGSYMKKIEDDMTSFIDQIKSEDFKYHPFKSRVSDNIIDPGSKIVSEEDCSESECKRQLILKSEFEAIRGKEYGYRYNYDNKNFLLSVKIIKLDKICQYKQIYKTYKMIQHSESSDTCTDDCSKCLDSIKLDKSVKDYQNLTVPDSSSWSCDGIGCASIGQGCTCAKCWCSKSESTAISVLKLIKSIDKMDICVGFSNKGFCKSVLEKEEKGPIKVIGLRRSENKCHDLIACKDQHCWSGPINDLSEFTNKFGINQETTGNEITVKYDVKYKEQCFFARHRWLKLEECCSDSYDYIKNLKIVNSTLKDNNIMMMPVDELGNWKLEIKLPKLRYNKEKSQLTLKGVKLDDCKGCYNCYEGASCLIKLTSDKNGYIDLKCKECKTDKKVLILEKGINSIPIIVYCTSQTGKLECDVGNSSASANYHLMEKAFSPHGNAFLNVDETKIKTATCENFMCVRDWSDILPDFEFTSFFSLVKWAVIIILISLLIYFAAMLRNFIVKLNLNKNRKHK